MIVAIPSARYIARGNWRAGLARSFAVKVMMPKPRKAKKVSATLEMMSRSGGYPDGASSDGFMLTSVTTAKKVRIPRTIKTITVCALATSFDPTMFTAVMTMMISAANTLAQTLFSPANIALA